MPHRDVDYSKSEAPVFDAVQDLINWYGPKWESVSEMMRRVKNPQQFSFYAGFSGVEGFPVKVWYELYHGGGSWDKAWAELKADDKNEGYEFEEVPS